MEGGHNPRSAVQPNEEGDISILSDLLAHQGDSKMKPTDDLMNEHRVIERMLGVMSKAADRIESDGEVDKTLFVGAADFLRNFADMCHHGKEEKLLFKKMVERGLPSESGPISVMLHEHEDGRAHVRAITKLAEKSVDGYVMKELVNHTRAYVGLLSQHIQKEDNVLYPLANEMLTPADQKEMETGFAEVEEKVMGPGVHEKYHQMLEEWEKEYE
jgi:hemerythrin-like domain-containing protein